MVLINHFDYHIPGHWINLVSGIGIHGNLIVILIQRIPIRRCDFFNPVMTDLQVLRQDQIAIRIRKEAGMNRCCRIGCHLLDIFLIIKVINTELCVFLKHRLFRLVILFDDFQLRFKFFIQKHPPYLGRIRIMLCDPHDKVIHRLIIMGRGRFPDKVCAVRKGNAAGMSFLVCKYFCRSILPNYYRFSRIKIIASIFLYRKVRKQISRKSGSGQQVSVRLPVIGCLDDFKGLLLYLLRRNALTLHGSGQITLIAAHQVMFTFISQIPHRRRDFFYKILPKIKVLHRRFSVFICGQRCYSVTGMIDHSGCPVRMYNILTGIQAIHCIFQYSVSLRNCLVRLSVFFLQPDHCIDSFIGKGMSKCHFLFTIVGIREGKGIYICLVPHISFRSLDFFHIIRKSNRQVCRKYSLSILSSHRFLNQRSLRYHNTSICIFNIASCIHSKHAAIQGI